MAPVSVVIPCFRCAATLERALKSVFQQTLRPLEIIVVDDGSADGTAERLRDMQEQHGSEHLRVIELDTNQGVGSARNAGWLAARGELLAFLDADDTWHPRKLELQCAFMRQRPEFDVTGHAHTFDVSAVDVPGRPSWKEITFDDLLRSNRFVTTSAMIKRAVSSRFREGQRHMEDHLLWLRLAAAGSRIALLQAPLATFHKAAFGDAGLSANVMAMECAELGNYRLLQSEGAISRARLLGLWAWSLIKFVRRLFIVALRRKVHARPAQRSSR